MAHEASTAGLSAAFLWFAAGAAGCGVEYPLCKADVGCPGGERCHLGHCVRCIEDSECGPAAMCVDGTCEAIPAGCTSSAECAPGLVCTLGVCIACFEDGQCANGQACVEGACGPCALDTQCATAERCIEGACVEAAMKPAKGAKKAKGQAGGGCTAAILFEFDSKKLTAETKKAIAALAGCLDDGKAHVILGHADGSGEEGYNLELGLARAIEVRDYLVGLGVPEAKLVVGTAGEEGAEGEDTPGDRRVDIL